MKYFMWAAGLLTAWLAVWFRAARKLTVNLTAFWGMTGVLMCAAGIFCPMPGRGEAVDAEQKRFFCILGTLLLSGGFFASILVSRLAVNKQERAVRLSLLGHDNEQRQVRLDERDEKDSFCD